MKVAIFVDDFFPKVGGTENAVINISNNLEKKGIKVIVFCPNYGKNIDYKKHFNFEVFPLPGLRIDKNNVLLLSFLSKKLLKKISDFNPDVINAHGNFNALKLANKIGKKLNIPVIATNHTKNTISFKNQIKIPFIVNRLIKRIIKNNNNADMCLTISNSMGKELQKFGFKKDYYPVINGVSFEKVSDLQKKQYQQNSKSIINFDKDKYKILLFIGRIEKAKNLEFTFKVLKKLQEKNFSYKMIFLGAGDELKFFEKLAKSLNIQDNIIFTGLIKDKDLLKTYISISDLFVFPSIFDNDSLAIGEAAMFNVPSITLKNTGSSERFIDKETGYISENDIDIFSDKIIEIFKDKETYEKVSKNCPSVYRSWDEEINQYIKYYNMAISNKKDK